MDNGIISAITDLSIPVNQFDFDLFSADGRVAIYFSHLDLVCLYLSKLITKY